MATATTEVDSNSLNVLGVLVHARPENLQRVRAALLRRPGVEVHATAPEGRMVVTIEADRSREAAEALQGLYSVEGVLGASLVYQYCDAEDASEQEA